MNKKAQNIGISNILIAMIVIGMVSAGSVFLIAGFMGGLDDVSNQDQIELETFNASFGHILDDSSGYARKITTDIEGLNKTKSGVLGAFGIIDSLISAAWNTLKMVWDSLDFISIAINYLTGAGSPLQIPSWVGTGIIAILMILISFSIYKMIFKVDV